MPAATKTTKTTRSTRAKTPTASKHALAVRERVMTGVHQTQQAVLDATEKVVQHVPAGRAQDLLAGIRLPDLKTSTQFTRDFATELLNSQRDFAHSMAKALRPSA